MTNSKLLFRQKKLKYKSIVMIFYWFLSLYSNLSLTEDLDFPEFVPTCTLNTFTDGSKYQSLEGRPSLSKQGHLHSRGANSSPASLAGSQTDIPLLLINGAPESDLRPSGSEVDQVQKVPASPSKRRCFQASFSGSQPSMKFVMNTSKFWFRPHISRAECKVVLMLALCTVHCVTKDVRINVMPSFVNRSAPAEALLKDKEAGTFVVRDSTSYRGSFGLAMKVDQSPTTFTAAAYPGKRLLTNTAALDYLWVTHKACCFMFCRNKHTLENS